MPEACSHYELIKKLDNLIFGSCGFSPALLPVLLPQAQPPHLYPGQVGPAGLSCHPQTC